MEINPELSKDHEQPREEISPELIDTIIHTDTEPLLRDGIEMPTYSLDASKVNDYILEAYGHEGNATSAYIEVVPFSSSLVVTYESGEYTQYTLDASVPEGGAQATFSHRIEASDNTVATLEERAMDISDLVLYVRLLDTLKQTETPPL